MPLRLALLLSLILHAALLAPHWLTSRQASPAEMEVRLAPPAVPTANAEAVSTEPNSGERAALQRLATTPRSLRGTALRRAQSALSKHLFYPPEAVALGLEGDVILLLTLTEHGQLVSAAIARSSGHALLDQAALDAARHIGALPGNPRQTLFPVNFRLQ